jgi:hypothetical protein
MRKLSSIQLTEETKEELGKLINHKGESYEDIILRLIEFYNEKSDTKRVKK